MGFIKNEMNIERQKSKKHEKEQTLIKKEKIIILLEKVNKFSFDFPENPYRVQIFTICHSILEPT